MMRILKDADEYISTMEWAEKAVEQLGEHGAEKLLKSIDAWIKAPARERKKAGLEIEKLNSINLCLRLAMQRRRIETFIAPGKEAIKRDIKHRQEQRQKRLKRQTWRGLTREQLEERNKVIVEHFENTRLKNSRLTINSYADKYDSKWDLKPRTLRSILTKSVGN